MVRTIGRVGLLALFAVPLFAVGITHAQGKPGKGPKHGPDPPLRQLLEKLDKLKPPLGGDDEWRKFMDDSDDFWKDADRLFPGPPKITPVPGGFRSVERFQEQTSWSQNGNQATLRHQVNQRVITVTGTVQGGRLQPREIRIQDGDRSASYANVNEVPAADRDQVRKLIESSRLLP